MRSHHAIPLEDDAALLVFQSHCGDQSRIPDVSRFYKDLYEFAPMDKGRVFAGDSRRHCCLVIKAKPGDLIVIAEPRSHGSRLDWLFLRIGEGFLPQLIEAGRKPSYSDIRHILSGKLTGPSVSLKLTYFDLRRLFQARVPSWLQTILSAQLDKWLARDPAAFVNFTPSGPHPGDLDRCITAAPRIMLERWKGLLNDHQLARCIRLSPEGAIRYALDKIPVELREDYLVQHATTALEHCRSELSGPDWAACASVLPKETYQIRMSLPSRDQAYILGTVYQILWCLPFFNPSAGERTEILESIREHPEVWLSLHQSDFGLMFDKLRSLAGIQPSQSLLHSLINHEHEEVRRRILEYIPALI